MVKRKYTLKENVFDNLDEHSAYWIGFLYGDGNCTCENKVRIALQWSDREHLFSFRNFIGSDRPVKERHRPGIEHNARIEFRSWRVHNKIKKYELTKRKDMRGRLDISLLQPDIRRHFVRGLFDADGSFYYNPQGKKSLFSEITGYKPLMKDIKNILVLDGVISDKKKITKNGSVFRIRLAAHDTINLIDYLYQGEPLYRMKRKYVLAKQYRERLNNLAG